MCVTCVARTDVPGVLVFDFAALGCAWCDTAVGITEPWPSGVFLAPPVAFMRSLQLLMRYGGDSLESGSKLAIAQLYSFVISSSLVLVGVYLHAVLPHKNGTPAADVVRALLLRPSACWRVVLLQGLPKCLFSPMCAVGTPAVDVNPGPRGCQVSESWSTRCFACTLRGCVPRSVGAGLASQATVHTTPNCGQNAARMVLYVVYVRVCWGLDMECASRCVVRCIVMQCGGWYGVWVLWTDCRSLLSRMLTSPRNELVWSRCCHPTVRSSSTEFGRFECHVLWREQCAHAHSDGRCALCLPDVWIVCCCGQLCSGSAAGGVLWAVG